LPISAARERRFDAHTVGFDALAETVAKYPLTRAERLTGIPTRTLEQAA